MDGKGSGLGKRGILKMRYDGLISGSEDAQEKNRARRKREPQSKRTRRNLLKARRRAKNADYEEGAGK